MTRALLTFAIFGLLGGVFFPQAREARIEPASVVHFSAGMHTFGASPREVAFGLALCRDAEPLPAHGDCFEERFALEGPQRRVRLPAFGLDRTEVTQAAYARCVLAGHCAPSRVGEEDPRLGGPRMPVVGVTALEAERYCEFAGGRLPTEPEWERAARSRPRSHFPWGRYFDPRRANHGRSPSGPLDADGFAYAAPVGSFPSGRTPEGLLDMAGNVWEWTAGPVRDTFLGIDAGSHRAIRGGSWNHPPTALRVTHWLWFPERAHAPDVGFRCAYDPPRSPVPRPLTLGAE